MNSKIRVFFILALCFFVIEPVVYGKQGPRIDVERYFLDFGTVEKGQILQKELLVGNIGDETLIIKGLFIECECVRANVSSERILANQKAKLKIAYDTKDNQVGRDSQAVYIISNDSQKPKLKITASVNVVSKEQMTLPQKEKEIYNNLKCCNCETPVNECICYHAKKMKAYVRELLAKGESKEDIFFQIAKNYSLETITNKQIRKDIKKRLIQEAGSDRPQIFIQPLFYNLGKIEKSQEEFVLKVKVENEGNKPLEINKLRASCICATIKLKNKGKESLPFGTKGSPSGWKEVIAPGKAAELIIILDLSHSSIHVGKLMRSFEVRSNDPVNSLLKIELEADIVE